MVCAACDVEMACEAILWLACGVVSPGGISPGGISRGAVSLPGGAKVHCWDGKGSGSVHQGSAAAQLATAGLPRLPFGPTALPPPAGQQLLRYAASLHLLDVLPDVMLVDDLQLLLDLPPAPGDRRPRDMAHCRVLAVLHDAVVSHRGGGGGCTRAWAVPWAPCGLQGKTAGGYTCATMPF